MKKIVIALLCMTSVGMMCAEDVLQVVPFETKAGATVDDALCFSVSMNNSSSEIWALQFDLLLPEGMTIDNVSGYDPFKLNPDRFPHIAGRDGTITWKHSVYYDLQKTGWYRIVIFTSETERIIGENGELFKVYYLTDESMQPGIHPIYIKGTVLTVTGSSDIKPGVSTSYCVIGESPLKNAEEIDLNNFMGYIPSWVVESINADLISNTATSVYMEQADSIGATIETANKNALYYVKAGTKSVEQLQGKSVVTTDANTCYCSNLYLYDGEYDLSITQKMVGSKAYFDRTFESCWITVCLPFAVTSEQVSLLKENGVQVEAMKSFDGSTITFAAVDKMTANTPYLIKCSDKMTPFAELAITEISTTGTLNDVAIDNIQMKGCFTTTMLNSDDNITLYVLDTTTEEFIKVDKNEKLMPFRAYVQLVTTDNLPATIPIKHESNIITTITPAPTDDVTGSNVYSPSGALIYEGANTQESMQNLTKGLYIVNRRKVFVP